MSIKAGHGFRFLWLVLLLIPLQVLAAPVVLDAKAQQQGKVELAGHLEAYYDSSGELSQREVASPAYAERFKALPRHFNGGFAKGAWWLRFDVERAADTTQDWWLELNAPYVDSLDIWLPQQGADGVETLRHRQIGGLAPLSSRDLAERTLVIRADALPQGRPLTVWMRLASMRTISLEGSFWQLLPLTEHFAIDMVLRVGVIGMAVLMTLLALFLGLALRDDKFLWYSAYVAAAVSLLLTTEGLMGLVVLPQQPLLAVRLHSMSMCLIVLMSAVLTLKVLELKTEFPRMAVLFRLIAFAGALGMVPALAGYFGHIAVAVNLLLLTMCVLTVPLTVVLVRRGVPSSWPHLIGFTVFPLTAAVHLAKNLGWIPYSDTAHYTYQFVFVINMLALFAGLGLRVRRTEQSALAASRTAATQLEAKVTERTGELEVEVQERRRAEEQLTLALQEQRNFLSMVSHEFRTPLSIIDASAQLVVEERLPVSTEDIQREVQKIHRATQRMVALLDTLLADDWLESATMHLRRAELDLVDLLDEACQQLEQASTRRIVFRPRSAKLSVLADAMLMQIAINNLLENAVKYSPADQPIEVDAGSEGGEVVICVRDHGIGIRADETERIFERHYRSPETLKRPGLGLGLFMVKRIVEQHGGSVTAGNAAGGGAEFRLRLPGTLKD